MIVSELYGKLSKIFQIQNSFNQNKFTLEEISRNFGQFVKKPARRYRIIICGFHNNEATITSFFDNLRSAFSLLSCDVDYIPYQVFFDGLRTESRPFLEKLAACDFIICCNFSGLVREICDGIGIPYICICIDRPLYFTGVRNNDIHNVIYIWTDTADVHNAEKYYFKNGRHAFLPHGGEINLTTSDVFKTERFMDVMVIGNYATDRLDELWQKDLPLNREAVNNIIALYEIGGKSWEECVHEAAGPLTDEEIASFMAAAGEYLDAHMRLKKRAAVVRALLDGGITVHCFGADWELTDAINHPNFLYHGYIYCEPGRELIKHTKILINDLPVFHTGSHERVFSAMLRGALCVSNYTDYFGEHFTDGENIVFFDYKDLNGLAQKVKYYLAHEEKRLQITKAAFEKARGEHTWLNRAAALLDIFEGSLAAR